MRISESYMGQLWRFAWATLLPAVPHLAWWALGLLGFSWLNLLLLDELWPHHPRAEAWFAAGLMLSLAPLPWLGACTAQRLTHRVRWRRWRGFWWLVALGAYVVAAVSSFILLIGLLMGLGR